MESKTKIFGHASHPIVVVVPLGLLTTAAIFDAISLMRRDPEKRKKWQEVSFYMIAAGILGGLVAAPLGFNDWRHIPANTRAKRVGAMHGLSNVVSLAMFGASWLLRRNSNAQAGKKALALSFSAMTISGVAGWMGTELVERLGVGVDDGAHLDAPSSLFTEKIVDVD